MKLIRFFAFTLIVSLLLFQNTQAKYPDDKPIKIVVHTKPGGAVDLMARQLSQVASKYCDQSIAVINKPGGSGLLALANVYNSKPDGYTILAFPAAFLAAIQTTNIGFGLEDFYYLACLTVSPEAIITSHSSHLNSLEDVITEAKRKPGNQKWCGPGSGTLDHLMAVKIWDKAGITAKWIPYGGGGPAIAAVMGNHADVYVGNPEDVLGRENNLKIVAISNKNRLKLFPEIPTFLESGYDIYDDVMWRGFAVKKGTDPEAIAYLEDLLKKCSEDTLWQNFIIRTRVESVFLENKEFSDLVFKDAELSQYYLKKAGFEIGAIPESAPFAFLFLISALCLSLLAGYHFSKKTHSKANGSVMISAAGFSIAISFLYISWYFPAPQTQDLVGAATVPWVWSVFLIITSVLIFFNSLYSKSKPKKSIGMVGQTLVIILVISIYTILIPFTGFFTATALMLLFGIYKMKYKNFKIIILTIGTVILFMYVVFYKILMVPLPEGYLF